MKDDLSDEAYYLWWDGREIKPNAPEIWQECRRRAEQILEQSYKDWEKEAWSRFGRYVNVCNEELVERRRAEALERKAFEEGYKAGLDHGGHQWGNVEMAWLAWQAYKDAPKTA